MQSRRSFIKTVLGSAGAVAVRPFAAAAQAWNETPPGNGDQSQDQNQDQSLTNDNDLSQNQDQSLTNDNDLSQGQDQSLNNQNELSSNSQSGSKSHTGDNTNSINIEGDDVKVGAITGAPVVARLAVPDQCMDGFSLSFGGGVPYVASGGLGFSYIKPAGVAMAKGYTLLDYLEGDKDTKEKATKGMSDSKKAKLECLVMEWELQREEREHQIAKLTQKNAHELAKLKLSNQHEFKMKMVDHFLDRESNEPGKRKKASNFEHTSVVILAAREIKGLEESFVYTAGAFKRLKNNNKALKTEDIKTLDVLMDIYTPKDINLRPEIKGFDLLNGDEEKEADAPQP